MAETQELLVDLKFRETGSLAATTTNLAALQIAAQKTQATLGNIGTAATSGLATLQVAAQKAQASMAGLSISDKFSLGIGLAKDALGNLGDTARGQATRISNAFANAGDQIRAKFAGIGADIQKGIGLGLGIGTVQLVARGVQEITGFLKDSITAAIEQEASTRRLTQALQENIPAWDGATDAVERAVKVAQSKGFQDQDAEQNLAHLTAATHDVTQAIHLQNVAMDLARFRNISLSDASDKLIRVIGGSARVAKELGIDFAKTATEAERLGQIEAVVAGQSQAFADTTAGKMAQASESIHNLQENIGKGLIPVLGDLAVALNSVLGDQGIQLAEQAGKFVKTATIEQIKAAREGVQYQLDHTPFSLTGTRDEIKGVLAQLDAAIDRERDGIDESTRSANLNALATAKMAAEASAATAAADHSTAAQRRVAEAELAVAQAQQDVADATADAVAAGGHDAATLAALATANNELVAAQNQLITSRGLATVAANTAIVTESQFTRNIEGNTAALWHNVIALDANAKQRAFWRGPTSRNAQSGDINQPNTGGMSSADYYLLQLDTEAADAAAAIADAKAGTTDYASVLKDKLGTALSAAKDLATTLFDKLHERHLQAIADTEKLAEKQHDANTQAISDALKLQLQRNAAPVTEAEKAQSAIEISRQNRDLHASLTAAQQTGDPEQIRRAQEALQSFQAAQHINYLKEEQARLDLAATKDAAAKQKTADDLLATAKTAQANAITAETARNRKQVDDFERALASLKERDKGKTPGQVQKDITALETRFGITTDAQGKHHIEDPLVTAIKNVKIPVPRLEFHATLVSPPIYLGARQIVAALASHQSPAATPGVRTGILTPARG